MDPNQTFGFIVFLFSLVHSKIVSNVKYFYYIPKSPSVDLGQVDKSAKNKIKFSFSKIHIYTYF